MNCWAIVVPASATPADADSWKQLSASGSVPSGHSAPCLVGIPAEGKMYMFGGRNNNEARLNDLHELIEAGGGSWQQLAPSSPSPLLPSPRLPSQPLTQDENPKEYTQQEAATKDENPEESRNLWPKTKTLRSKPSGNLWPKTKTLRSQARMNLWPQHEP